MTLDFALIILAGTTNESELMAQDDPVSSFNDYVDPQPHLAGIVNKGLLSHNVPGSEFYTDVQSGTLPQVSWIVPAEAVSEHPTASPEAGQKYVVTLVNTIMQSQYWKNAAMFVAWDDWGGFYDHRRHLSWACYGVSPALNEFHG